MLGLAPLEIRSCSRSAGRRCQLQLLKHPHALRCLLLCALRLFAFVCLGALVAAYRGTAPVAAVNLNSISKVSEISEIRSVPFPGWPAYLPDGVRAVCGWCGAARLERRPGVRVEYVVYGLCGVRATEVWLWLLPIS